MEQALAEAEAEAPPEPEAEAEVIEISSSCASPKAASVAPTLMQYTETLGSEAQHAMLLEPDRQELDLLESAAFPSDTLQAAGAHRAAPSFSPPRRKRKNPFIHFRSDSPSSC